MESPSFVVRLADLERGPLKASFTLGEDWLTRELSDAQAVPQGPGSATVELMKAGGTVIVRGKLKVSLTVPCVVTLDPIPFTLEPELFLQLARDPDDPHRETGRVPRATGGAFGTGRRKGGAKDAEGGDTKDGKHAVLGPGAPKTNAKGKGRTERRSAKDAPDDPELSLEEAASDTFKGEEIVLDGFFREFILLEIPPYPRRSDLPSSEESLSSRPLAAPPGEAKPVDPRLLPLLGLANRLRGAANKE